MAASLEIKCTACGRVALARAEPKYEDFRKVAESFVCTACGHRYPSREQTPFLAADGRPPVFSAADRPDAVRVFKSDERRRSCAWCRHFIVNPFHQRCGLNNREVEATDVCGRFAARPEQTAAAAPAPKATDASRRFDALFQDAPAAAPPAVTLPTPPPPAPALTPVPAPPPAPMPAPEAPAPASAARKETKAKRQPAAPAPAPRAPVSALPVPDEPTTKKKPAARRKTAAQPPATRSRKTAG